MSYQVIARKWRPQCFADMVGQEPIARTLKNAIISGRIAHAYLFVGPRGIGKTTTARIFAKAMNCLHPVDGEPCCKCRSCLSIAEETNVDVIEFDAATHTQVEKARELCEDVLHLPIASKYKVYIIDEVHMLTKGAWNALLKTVEEPPAHAKFIFATTEVHKVLPTVISRCQRFDLRRIKSPDIAGRLRLICDAENVRVTDAALQVIARAADGGMRDAQSLLDQLISFFGGAGTGNAAEINETQAMELFGLAAQTDMTALVQAIVTNDRAGTIRAIHNFAIAGKNLETLYEETIAWLRGILLCRIVDNPQDILEDTIEKIELFQTLGRSANPGALQRLVEQLAASGYQLHEAINKQVFMESIFLKAMRIAHAVQIEDLIARINQIRSEGSLDALNSVVPLYEMPAGQIIVPRNSVYAPSSSRGIETKAVSADETVQIPPAPAPAPAPAVEQTAEQEKSAAEQEPQIPAQSEPETAPAAEQITVTAEESEPAAVEKMEAEQIAETADIPAEPETVPESPAIPEPEIGEVSGMDFSEPEEIAPASSMLCDNYSKENIWQELVLDIRDNLKKDFLAAAMADGTPDSIQYSRLIVSFDQDYEAFQLKTVEAELPLLERRLRDISGDSSAGITLIYQQGLATPAQIKQREDVDKLKKTASENPLVQDALDLFSGTLTDAHDMNRND